MTTTIPVLKPSDPIAAVAIPRANDGWEVKLAPPVNRILHISRDRTKQLWQTFGV